jgi:hypothetical protein
LNAGREFRHTHGHRPGAVRSACQDGPADTPLDDLCKRLADMEKAAAIIGQAMLRP